MPSRRRQPLRWYIDILAKARALPADKRCEECEKLVGPKTAQWIRRGKAFVCRTCGCSRSISTRAIDEEMLAAASPCKMHATRKFLRVRGDGHVVCGECERKKAEVRRDTIANAVGEPALYRFLRLERAAVHAIAEGAALIGKIDILVDPFLEADLSLEFHELMRSIGYPREDLLVPQAEPEPAPPPVKAPTLADAMREPKPESEDLAPPLEEVEPEPDLIEDLIDNIPPSEPAPALPHGLDPYAIEIPDPGIAEWSDEDTVRKEIPELPDSDEQF